MNDYNFLDFCAEGRTLSNSDRYRCTPHLDYLCLLGKPLTPISTTDGPMFESTSIRLAEWRRIYRADSPYIMSFSLRHRTFYLGVTGRMQWYIVMRPTTATDELDVRGPERRRAVKDGVKHCAMRKEDGIRMLRYIVWVCSRDSDLVKTGLDERYLQPRKCWQSLGLSPAVTFTRHQFSLFQEIFCREFESYFRSADETDFFLRHTPTIHVYDYGQDMPLLRHAADHPAKFTDELARQFSFDGVDEVSAAVAANIGFESADGSHLSALADFRACWDQFEDKDDVTFFPLALSPRAGNIQSSAMPSLIRSRVLNELQSRTRLDNHDRDVLGVGDFQIYSTLKQTIRPTANDLLVAKGHYTAVLSVDSAIMVDSRHKARHQKLSNLLSMTNENALPIHREAQRIQDAIEHGRDALRIEVNLSFKIGSSAPMNANAAYFVHHILQPVWEGIGSRRNGIPDALAIVFDPEVCSVVVREAELGISD
ncbi:hypothetical protein V1506DRAFT_496453 [Lipomyces tetrasporus]